MLKTLPYIFFSCVLVSLGMYLSTYAEDKAQKFGNYSALGGMWMYLCFFAAGWSSTPWSVNTEIYPIHLAGTGSALSTSTNWFSNFLVSTFFMSIMKSSDVGKVVAFLLLGGFCILAYVFVNSLLPETKGKLV